jgi:hypothetical protein
MVRPVVHGCYRKIPCLDLRKKFIDDEPEPVKAKKSKDKKKEKDDGLDNLEKLLKKKK